MFYLTTHSTHFVYGCMASDIWLRTILIVRKETRCRHIGYSFRLTARVLLYAPSHRQDSTYHGFCYTSCGALTEFDHWSYFKYSHTHTHTHTHTHMHTQTNMHPHAHTHTHTHVHTDKHAHTRTHADTHTNISFYTHYLQHLTKAYFRYTNFYMFLRL